MRISWKILRVPTASDVGFIAERSCVGTELNGGLRRARRSRSHNSSGCVLIARKLAIAGVERTILAPIATAPRRIALVDELAVGAVVITTASPVGTEISAV